MVKHIVLFKLKDEAPADKKLTAMNSTTATTAAIHTVLFCFFVQVC